MHASTSFSDEFKGISEPNSMASDSVDVLHPPSSVVITAFSTVSWYFEALPDLLRAIWHQILLALADVTQPICLFPLLR